MSNFYKSMASICVKARTVFADLHPYFRYLIFLLASIGGAGFSLSFLMLIAIFFTDQLYQLPFCFSNKCFINFYDHYSSAFIIAKTTLDFIVVLATVGAIFVALLSYLSTLKSSYFTNHISHLALFQSFFVEEVRKRDLLSISSFDPHKIYGLIYSESRSGDMSLSQGYFNFIEMLNQVILDSNFRSFKASKGPFIYKDHQAKMISILDQIGFDLQFMPKKDFYEIETQILSLLDSVSNSFCGGNTQTKLEKRIYR